MAWLSGIGRPLLGAAALWLAAMPAGAQVPAGTVAAVDRAATGLPAAALPQGLAIGDGIVVGERVTTGPDGRVQLLFADGSTVMVGPSSDLTIDDFAFDPAARTARLAMTETAGTIRFIGGRASKDAPVRLDTPTATIEIRGGVNFTTVAADGGATETTQAYGRDTVAISKSTGERQTLVKNGFDMRIAADQPIATARLDPGRLGAMLASLEGTSGGGGAPAPDPRQLRDIATSNSGRAPAADLAGPLAPTDSLNAVTSGTDRLAAAAAQAIAVRSAFGVTGNAPAVLAAVSATNTAAGSAAIGTLAGGVSVLSSGVSTYSVFTVSSTDIIAFRGICSCTLTLSPPPGFTIGNTGLLTGPGLPPGGIFVTSGSSYISAGVFPARR
jgi:hypothetical protein